MPSIDMTEVSISRLRACASTSRRKMDDIARLDNLGRTPSNVIDVFETSTQPYERHYHMRRPLVLSSHLVGLTLVTVAHAL